MNGSHSNGVVRTVCSLPDGGTCGLLMNLEGGTIVGVKPATFPERIHEGACLKGLSVHHWVYHRDRLQYPLKRSGNRGSGNWQRISWDEAFSELAGRFEEIAEKHGPASIAWAVHDLPLLRQGGYSRLASASKATWVDCAGFGDLAGPCADFLTYGWPLGEIHTSLVKEPRTILVWGANPGETDWRRMGVLMQAQKNGGRLVVIDPRASVTARRADQHVQIRPGTDTALALGMMNVILAKGLEDSSFILEYTMGPLLVRRDTGLLLRESDLVEGGNENGFMVLDNDTGKPRRADEPGVKPVLTGGCSVSGIACSPSYQLLLDLISEYTVDRVSQITEISADIIEHLAIEYATRKPSAIHRGWGVQRTFHGDITCRAINTLAAITGNVNPRRPSRFVLNTRTFLMPAGWYNRLPIMLLYDAITKEQPLAIKAVCFAGRNYVNQLPNMNRITNELLPKLELVVVCDLFMTETAKHADYVLPTASFCECVDLVPGGSPWLPYLQLQQKVIEPLFECKSDFEIAAGLGRRMGFGEYFDRTEKQYIEGLLASGHPSMEGVTFERLEEAPVQAEASERPAEFRTPTGRIEFYVERLREFGQELPVYIEPIESNRQSTAETYPLSLISPHSRYRLHSTMANEARLLKFEAEPMLEISPHDARPRGIDNGDVVQVFNDRGQVKLKARVSEGIRPGVVAISEGWWPEQFVEGHLNELTHETINPAQNATLGPNAALCDVLVDVRRETADRAHM